KKLIGLPRASTSVWILVLNPPVSGRWLGLRRLFLGPGAVLMGAHDGAVDHRIFIVGIGRQMHENPLPDSRLGPTAEAPMHVLPVPEAVRQVSPRDARAKTIEHRLDEQPVVRRRHP